MSCISADCKRWPSFCDVSCLLNGLWLSSLHISVRLQACLSVPFQYFSHWMTLEWGNGEGNHYFSKPVQWHSPLNIFLCECKCTLSPPFFHPSSPLLNSHNLFPMCGCFVAFLDLQAYDASLSPSCIFCTSALLYFLKPGVTLSILLDGKQKSSLYFP